MALYSMMSLDSFLRAVVKHQVSLDKRVAYCVLRVANGLLSLYQLGMKFMEEGLFGSNGKAVS